MDMNIIFLSGEHEGKKGVQRTDESHSVIGIFLDDGTEVTDGCSYVSQWQDAENKRYVAENAEVIAAAKALADAEAQRQSLKAENDALMQQIADTQLKAHNAALKAQLAELTNV